MFPLVTKPCENCGEPVTDQDDPNYKDKWTCYHCHCILTGRDVKKALNSLSQMMKMGLLVEVERPNRRKPPS